MPLSAGVAVGHSAVCATGVSAVSATAAGGADVGDDGEDDEPPHAVGTTARMAHVTTTVSDRKVIAPIEALYPGGAYRFGIRPVTDAAARRSYKFGDPKFRLRNRHRKRGAVHVAWSRKIPLLPVLNLRRMAASKYHLDRRKSGSV